MYPLLYASTSSIVSDSNMKLLGRMTLCQSCSVTEERNGNYTLSAIISINDSCADMIKTQYFIKAKPNPFQNLQFFEIYDLIHKKGIIEIKAKHIKHNFYNNVVTVEGDIGGTPECTPQDFWDEYAADFLALSNNFNFYSNISAIGSMELGYSVPCTVGDMCSNKEGSLLSVYGGEYEYDNFTVKLLQRRGKNSGYRLRWGQNISSCEQTVSSSDIASHIVAVAKVYDSCSGNNYYLTGNVYPLTSTSSKLQKIYLLDVSEEASQSPEDWTINTHTGENIDLIKGQLNVRATSNRQKIAESNGKPTVNIKVDFRAELDEMIHIGLCDTVSVDVNGEDVFAKVIKTEYDVLLERWNKLELGHFRSKISNYILK